jgi:hypothetical protein
MHMILKHLQCGSGKSGRGTGGGSRSAASAGFGGAGSGLTVTAALVLLAAACGGTAPSSSGVATLPSPSAGSTAQAGNSPTAAASGQIAQAIAYAQCMRSNGVPSWPDPDSSATFPKTQLEHLGVTDSKLQAGESACQALLPNGGSGPTQVQLQQSRAQALSFAQCMRSYGVPDFPDPDDTGRIPDPASLGLNQGAPQFQAANEACGDDRPGYFPSNAEYNTWAGTHGSGGSSGTGSGSSATPGATGQP